jgi:hypothetical protein
MRLLADDGIQLIANARLVSEYRKLEKELNSPTSNTPLGTACKKDGDNRSERGSDRPLQTTYIRGGCGHGSCRDMFANRSNTHYE